MELVEIYKLLEGELGKEKAEKIINYVKEIANGVKEKVKNELKDELVTKDLFYAEIRRLEERIEMLEKKYDELAKDVKELSNKVEKILLELEKIKAENRINRLLLYFIIILNILAIANKQIIEALKLLFRVGG